VIDDDLRPVRVADAYLRHVRFGRDDAESTTKSYAGAVALYLTWWLWHTGIGGQPPTGWGGPYWGCGLPLA
jgi:hypothetical protein